MSAKHPPQLRVILNDSTFDIEEACTSHPYLVRETLLSALLLFPLNEQTINRIQLGEAFRHSLQTERQSTPYRLHSIISACKQDIIDGASLEAKFFRHGGVHAVTALAVAAADDNNIMLQLEDLRDVELKSFLESIAEIKRHPDVQFLAEALDRKRPSITSKKTQLVRPRPSRSVKTSSMSKQSLHKVHLQSQRRTLRPDRKPCELIVAKRRWHTHQLAPLPSQISQSETMKKNSAGYQPYAEAAMITGLQDFDYDATFDSDTGIKGSPRGGDFRIDLDDMDNISSPLDTDGLCNGNYGIDLDQLSTF